MRLDDYSPTEDLSRALTIPSRWYTDASILALERARVFARTWQPVAHVADLATAGEYCATNIVGEPVVVTRDKHGMLRALSNVCRHRASTIAEGRGCSPSLRCPYHNWTYGLDGRLISQPEFEGVNDWNMGSVRLPQFRLETWGPFVFVNQSQDSDSLGQMWGNIPSEVHALGCDANQLRFVERREYVIRCNWKVYVDNYLEGYHLPAAHPGLYQALDYKQYRVDTFRYHSSQYSPLRDGRGGNALYYWIFPNFMLNIYPDNLSSNLIVPLGPDRTLTIFEWFTLGGAATLPEGTIEFSDEIQREDIKICEAVQNGLESAHYNQGRFSVKRENGVHHFHLLLNEFLRNE